MDRLDHPSVEIAKTSVWAMKVLTRASALVQAHFRAWSTLGGSCLRNVYRPQACGALALVGERLLSDSQIALASCFVETPQVLKRDGKWRVSIHIISVAPDSLPQHSLSPRI